MRTVNPFVFLKDDEGNTMNAISKNDLNLEKFIFLVNIGYDYEPAYHDCVNEFIHISTIVYLNINNHLPKNQQFSYYDMFFNVAKAKGEVVELNQN